MCPEYEGIECNALQVSAEQPPPIQEADERSSLGGGPDSRANRLGRRVKSIPRRMLGKIDILAAVATGGNVVQATGKFKAQGAGHGWSLEGDVLVQDLTPFSL
jgi:hypothetical protein